MADNKGVMIFIELVDGKLSAIAKELLGAGRKLANELKEELSAVAAGSGVANAAAEAIAFGADKVYVVDAALLKDYRTDAYVTVVRRWSSRANPRILLLGQTTIGRDLAPRAAARLATAAVPGLHCAGHRCRDQAAVNDQAGLRRQRPRDLQYGTLPQIATVRAKAMAALEPDADRKGQVVAVDAGLDPAAIKTTVLQKGGA